MDICSYTIYLILFVFIVMISGICFCIYSNDKWDYEGYGH